MDRHDILKNGTVAFPNELSVLHIGSAAAFGYENRDGAVDVNGFTAVSQWGIPDPVSLFLGNSYKTNWFYAPHEKGVWSHGNSTYFAPGTPFTN